MSEEELVNQTRSYESAAKDIEQEKKMVAALKRLSISNMMSYDPDLPIEDMEYQYQYQQQNDDLSNRSPPTSPQARRSSSLSRKSSLKGRPSPSEDFIHQDQATVEENISDEPQQEQVLDTDTLLWVPANLHPEVDPEQFKIHVKTTVGEIMERKLSRKNSLSRHSSLSSSFLADDKEERSQSEPETPEKNTKNDNLEVEQQSYQEKRFSNPSLRDLSFELENLSRLAGMDSTDAVTIARTLSSSSLGYTDVEKQAFDELSSPPHTSPNNSTRRRETDASQNKAFVDPESPTFHKTVNRLPQEYVYHSGKHEQQPQYFQQQSRQPQNHQMPKSQFSPNDFSLKRSRRPDYRKLSNPSASGSSLQNNKAGKLAELRNNLNSSSPSTVAYQYHLAKQPEHKSKGKQRKARDSQLLFSYRNPNVLPESQSSKDSPYPTSASSSSPLEQKFNTHKFSQHNVTAKRISHIKNHKDQYGLLQKQGYSRSSSRSSSGGSVNHSVQSLEKEKARPIQSPPNQPLPSHTINKQKFPPSSQNQYRSDNRKHHHRSHAQRNDNLKQQIPQIPQQQRNYVFQLQIPKTRSENRKFDSSNQSELVEKEPVPQIKISNDSSDNKTEDKSTQLNQNLDLLRSEINEFKESLTKIDSPTFKESLSLSDSDLPESSDNNESDFSFEASYQNISYEDSLGIEKDVLNQLDKEKSSYIDAADNNMENKTANPFISPEKQTPTQEPVSALIDERDNNIRNNNDEDLLEDFEIDFDRNANKDAIELSEIDQDPLVDEIAVTPDEEFIPKSSEPVSQVSSAGEVQKKKSFGLLPNHSSSSVNSDTETKKTLKKKKSWPWLKERSASFSCSDGNKLPSLPEAKSPSRSFSTPETLTKKRQEQQQISKEIPKTQDVKPSASIGKENMISKFFKKKRSNSATSVLSSDITNMDSKPVQDSGVTIDYESDSEAKKNMQGKLKGGIFKKINRNKQNEKEKERLQSLKSTSVTSLVSLIEKGSSTEDLHEVETSREIQNGHIIQDSEKDFQSFPHSTIEVSKQDEIEPSSISREEVNEETLMNNAKGKEKETEKTKPKIKTKLLETRKERAHRKSEQTKTEVSKKNTDVKQDKDDIEDQTTQTIKPEDEKEVPRSALDVQEKLKKSIKRTSKANQPIEFTDSAFGFPLPPPSQSTLVMLDYRFPVHVERAIYRLSHLKLANPKRSLREQVLLSNFMYAYLNLVDHTLHLEQLNNSSENTTEVHDDTKELNFATDDEIVTDDELDDTKHYSDQVSIDLDIVDLSNTPGATTEVQ